MDFTCTATRRPGILRDTLESFSRQLSGVDLRQSRLILNLDPVPAAGNGSAVLAVAEAFFGSVVVNQPQEASFPAAVRWCWQQAQGEYFFHLEDDWLLERRISLDDMRWQFECRRDEGAQLACVHLRAYDTPEDLRICLAPGLWRTAHAATIAARLSTTANPERQLRPAGIGNPEGGKHDGFFGLHYPHTIVLRDIGRTWMQVNGLQRHHGKDFTHWTPNARTH